MNIFHEKHRNAILGIVEGFDRLIFKGYLTSMFPQGAFGRYLSRRGILLKNARKFFEAETERIIVHAKDRAKQARCPYIYLKSAQTRASDKSKEDRARAIAERDGITEGLVCIFSVLEGCTSFAVVGNHRTHRREVVRRRRKRLHPYWYLIHPQFGWMQVRIQSWAAYSIQIYIHGREWMCQQLPERNIGFVRSTNKTTRRGEKLSPLSNNAARRFCHVGCHLLP